MYNAVMIAFVVGSLHAPNATATTWYGPASAVFPAAIAGNPYDPVSNDAWVIFRSGATSIERPAYYEDNAWHAQLVGKRPGRYTASLRLNGHLAGKPISVSLKTPIKDGYVRIGGPWGFRMDSGTTYWPMGHNLAWQSKELPDIPTYLGTMAANGLNWSRIWACHWDGKNPWFPPMDAQVKLDAGQFWPPVLQRWDAIVHAAEINRVRFQFVLFHHGPWSSTTDSNWGENPWNAANGGFLKNPEEFFTNPEAIARSRAWVRYAIARWGCSPGIMSWEIFNEVQWVDAVKNGHAKVVGKWHDDMADYIRSLDPVGHLVTTSSDLRLPIWSKMDYLQPHAYSSRLLGNVLATEKTSKPLFFGETGPSQLNGNQATQQQAVRDSIWGGILAHHAGAAQFWSWDAVPKNHLHRDYATASRILKASGVLGESGLSPVSVDLQVPHGAAPLKFNPAGDWEPNRQYDFKLPHDSLRGAGRMSAYFQGRNNPQYRTQPVRFHFHAPASGDVKVRVDGVSATGGEIRIRINGQDQGKQAWLKPTDLKGSAIVTAPYPAGDVTVELDNQGPDWVRIESVDFGNIADAVTGFATGNARFLLARLERVSASKSSCRPAHTGLVDGYYAGEIVDLATGRSTLIRTEVRGGAVRTPLGNLGSDSILWLRKLDKR